MFPSTFIYNTFHYWYYSKLLLKVVVHFADHIRIRHRIIEFAQNTAKSDFSSIFEGPYFVKFFSAVDHTLVLDTWLIHVIEIVVKSCRHIKQHNSNSASIYRVRIKFQKILFLACIWSPINHKVPLCSLQLLYIILFTIGTIQNYC